MKRLIAIITSFIVAFTLSIPGVLMMDTTSGEVSAATKNPFAEKLGVPKTEDENEAALNSAIVLFEDSDGLSKAKVKSELSKGSESVSDIKVEEVWNFEEEGRNAETDSVALVSSNSLSTDKLIKQLNKRKDVKYAEPDYKVHMRGVKYDDATNDTYSGYQWSMQNGENTPNISAQWGNNTGSDSIVAALDTGVDYTNEDLKDAMWDNDHYPTLKGECGYDFINGDGDPMDDNGHGSHVAGIIGAVGDNGKGVSGVNRDSVKIMALKVLDSEGSASLSHEIAAYHYISKAIDLGENITAINNSWGGGEESKIFTELVDVVGEKGAITVCAAGNDGADNDMGEDYPSNIDSPYLVSVAATGEDGSLASYSNYGKHSVDVAAPGSDILSTVNEYVYNPSIYGDDQSSVSQEYNDFEGSEAWGIPKVEDFYINDETYEDFMTENPNSKIDIKVNEGTVSDKYFLKEGNKSLGIEMKNLKEGDLVCYSIPYELNEGEDTPAFSIMAQTKGPKNAISMFGGPILAILDVPKDTKKDVDTLGDMDIAGTFIEGEQDDWSHFVTTRQSSDVVEDELERELIVMVFAYKAGDYSVNIDDMGLSKANVSDEAFGKYDFYSGTSMAAPYISGAIALKAAELNFDASPEEVVNETVSLAKETKLQPEDKAIEQGGAFDFSKKPAKMGPRIGKITVDPDKKIVKIEGASLDSDCKVEFGDGEEYQEIAADKIKFENGAIIIDDADGEYINNLYDIKVSGNDKESIKKDVYLVRGKKDYSLFENMNDIPTQAPLATDGKNLYAISQGTINKFDLSHPEEEAEMAAYIEPEDLFKVKHDPNKEYGSLIGPDLVYSNNKLYTMVEYGEVDAIEEQEEGVIVIGKTSKQVSTSAVNESDEEGEPTAIYSGERKLITANLSDGMVSAINLPDELKKVEDFTLAAYNGKIYAIGGYDHTKTGDKEKVGLSKQVMVYDTAKKEWSQIADIPEGRAGGQAIQSGDKLIYTMGISEEQTGEDLSEQNCPKNLIFDGKNWTKDDNEKTLDTIKESEIVRFGGNEYYRYEASIGLVKGGLVYLGLPVWDLGDSFTYDMDKHSYKDTGYNFIKKIDEEEIFGTSVGAKAYGFDGADAYTMPVQSGLVKLAKKVKGKGKVTGTGSFMPGNDANVKIKAGKWKHIKSIKLDGKKVKVKKNAKKKTVKVKTLTKDRKINVVFAKDKQVKVTKKIKGKGKVTGAKKYYVGQKAKIKVKAKKGYYIKSLKVGKKKIKLKKNQTKKTYTIKKIKKNTKVKVVFAKKK